MITINLINILLAFVFAQFTIKFHRENCDSLMKIINFPIQLPTNSAKTSNSYRRKKEIKAIQSIRFKEFLIFIDTFLNPNWERLTDWNLWRNFKKLQFQYKLKVLSWKQNFKLFFSYFRFDNNTKLKWAHWQ